MAEGHAAFLTTGQILDEGITWRQPHGVHRQFQRVVKFPQIVRVDHVLIASLLIQHLFHLFRRQVFTELHVELVILVQDRLVSRNSLLNALVDG